MCAVLCLWSWLGVLVGVSLLARVVWFLGVPLLWRRACVCVLVWLWLRFGFASCPLLLVWVVSVRVVLLALPSLVCAGLRGSLCLCAVGFGVGVLRVWLFVGLSVVSVL